MTDKNILEIKKPEPDSQYRLRNCPKCGSDDVAYMSYDSGRCVLWRVTCSECKYTVDKGNKVRHDVQMLWNKGVAV